MKDFLDQIKALIVVSAVIGTVVGTIVGVSISASIDFVGTVVGVVITGSALLARGHKLSHELKLTSAPGYRILRLLEVLVSPKKYDQVYEPIVADWNAEYLKAIDNKRSKAKLIAIRIRYTWALIAAFGLDFAVVEKVAGFFTK